MAPRAAEIDRTGEFPTDLVELLAAQDILALPFPGVWWPRRRPADRLPRGRGASTACATTGLILAVHELASLPLLLAGTTEQQARWFPALAAGRTLIAFALTEAEAGSDVAAIRTRAVRDGDTYVLDGAKRFISQASWPSS